MTKDPVCKMVVDEKEAKWITEYEGVVYYFCSPECKQEFDDDPEEYALIDLG